MLETQFGTIMSRMVVLILVVASLHVNGELRKFEYKYSFKPPFLTKEDGTIPFWTFGGHAIASDDSIRITPSLKNKRGWVWTQNASTFDNWEVDVSFRITGRGRVGADGIAIWFTDKANADGPVYGSADKWNGLGIFLDSYDNDQIHNNPAVIAVLNDGQQEYDHDHDGAQQAVGSCVRDYRNKPSPVHLRIRLMHRRLSVWLTNGLSEKDKYEPCFTTDELADTIPTRGYFGISAATGALADDHDIQFFLVHSLVDPDAKPAENVSQPDAALVQPESQQPAISDEERVKFEKEFEGFLEKLKQAKSEFEKDHGSTSTAKIPVDLFESEADLNVRQILVMQSDTLETVRQIQNALNDLAAIKASLPAGVTGGIDSTANAVLEALPDLVRKNDLLQTQATLSSGLTNLRSSFDEVQRRVVSHPTAPAANTYDSQALAQTTVKRIDDLSHDLTGAINSLRDELQKLVRSNIHNQQAAAQSTCSCVSSTFLVVIIAVQLALFIAFEMYQRSRETHAKKFY